MMDTVLFFAHYIALLLFGILLSLAFAGVRLKQRQAALAAGSLFVLCGLLQLGLFLAVDEALVWKLYPLIVHLPIGLVLCVVYRKRIATALAAISTAYLFCQPAKWGGMLCAALTESYAAEQITRLLILLGVGLVAILYLAPSIAGIFNKDSRSVLIFSTVPMVSYLFDYAAGIYTNLLQTHLRIMAEFMPFLLCVFFMVFCMVYYRQYEQKADAERREQLVSVRVRQQAAQIEEVRHNEQELRLLRHDMRHFLISLMACLENGNSEKTQELIRSYATHIDATSTKRFCDNDMVHFVLADYAAKCKESNVAFHCTVELPELKFDEIMFCSILSNALENALNAQKNLFPEEKRSIKLMLKAIDQKLLLSVKNPVDCAPVFVDGLPVAEKEGHGYGVQSIRYLAQRMGGNCQFSVQDGIFVVRVVL